MYIYISNAVKLTKIESASQQKKAPVLANYSIITRLLKEFENRPRCHPL